ncbi:MAG: HAMP domain-containing histidine kinase [Bacteroidetes bacterium]|nr:HAMP domain-containing histidine kinase [Bacteroidota bacterium]
MIKRLTAFNPVKFSLILLFTAFVIAGGAEYIQYKTVYSGQALISNAEKKLIGLEKEMKASLKKIKSFEKEDEFHNYFFHSGFENIGFSFYVIQNGKIIYWSDNEPVVTPEDFNSNEQGKLLSLPNGDFLFYSETSADKKFVGLIILRHNYDYENKYLVNGFNQSLGLSASFVNDKDGKFQFHLPDGKVGYNLHFENISDTENGVAKYLYFLSVILCLIALHILFRNYFRSSVLAGSVFVLVVLLLRTLMIAYKIPGEFYKLQIFSPQYYASSFYFNSLGDLLINASIFLLIAVNLYQFSKKIRSTLGNIFLALILVCALAGGFHSLITGLIINSQISFDVNTPLEMSEFSLWAFAAISILLITFLFFIATVLRLFSGYKISTGHAWVAIAFCALYSSVLLNELNCFKERESRKLLAQKIGVRQDHVAEYLFDEAGKKIESDTLLPRLIQQKENITAYITQKYLNGYLSRFESNIYAFPANDTNYVIDGRTLANFQQQADNGKPTFGRNLVYLNNDNGRSSYLAFIPIESKQQSVYTIVILMNARFLQTEEGFPELFMSGQSQENIFPKEYSFARYSDLSLIYEYGSFTYSLTDKDFRKSLDEFTFIDLNGYNHLVYRMNANSAIVVSRPIENIFTLVTLFSWMFAFSGITAFLIYILSIVLSPSSYFTWNLMRRIQVSVVAVVVLSFILVGAGTVIYIDKKYQDDERKSISDQVNALWFMISEDASAYLNGQNYPELFGVLDRIVGNTNIDFNLFDADGGLLYSSQPKIYKQNIVSQRMNPEALYEIRKNQLTQFINPENAGQLKYISAYAPITDRNGAVKAYLSLPYFEKQNELNKEVSGFLSALLNIYVFLLAIAVFVTVVISSRITKPLLLIQEKMSGVRLGSINEKIAYQKNDEIGQLVHEYNRMLEELASSADKLAQSERESAWREMAKQVAHEIKNPLTPMKLSVQHLQRNLQHKDDKDREFVNRISETLIQQIDTLSAIATSFSDFAKMPQAKPEKLDLLQIITPIADLYREIPNLEIKLSGNNEAHFVHADKDHLNRIFSNVLKNALQAIPDERKGKITIDIKNTINDIRIEISDNGIGIPDDKKDKIFIPNFTTKSSGTGLGLAMVKNLVEQSGGKVWFTTEVNSGTTFYIDLPKA